MRYIGLDVHKNNIAACVIANNGKPVKSIEIENRSGMSEITEYMKDQNYCVMMESSTYVYDVYRYFESIGIEAHVAHAKGLKMITSSDKKTDKNDAETIGRYLRLWKKGELKLSMAYIPTKEEAELKDICRLKEEVSRKIGDESRRIKSHMFRNMESFPDDNDNLAVKYVRKGISEAYPNDAALQSRLRYLEELRKENFQLTKMIMGKLPNDKNVEILCSVPGIARQSAVQIMSMIVDVKRFEDPEKMCSYFGLVPRVRDSGEKEHHGRMTKNGDKMMRIIMERVTLSHIRFCDSSITAFYKRKLPEMGEKKALISASRKMLTMIHSLLLNQRKFRV
ncbi:MAG: IS110 family transposase [Methanomassiliicoccaceae archaeon]|nr:IS110 family transposase [Methanomassiliicoccaceae archaeon]